MIKVSKAVLLFALLGIITSCTSNEVLTGDAYIAFMEKEGNGFRKKVTTGDYAYTFQYKSTDYILLKEQKAGLPAAQLQKRATQLDSTVWFNVMINTGNSINPLKANATDLNEYNKRVEYFLSSAAKNFTLSYGGQEEMRCIGYFFENNYGLTPMDIMIVGFHIPDKKPVQDVQLEYNDELFNYGPVRIAIAAEKFTSIPQIKK